MNQLPGIIGKKLGNTQVFAEDGNVSRVTVIDVASCKVVGKRTKEKDGYSALRLGLGDKKEKQLTKAEKIAFEKAGVSPVETIKELRLTEEEVAKYEVGSALVPSTIFSPGQHVDVSGTSIGRGFTGVMKRWNFKGSATATHGTHEYQRHGGSIGTNMTPGRTFLNLKMPGHYGSEKVTILNLKVLRVDDEKGLILIEGAVPGSKNGLVSVRHAVKKSKKK